MMHTSAPVSSAAEDFDRLQARLTPKARASVTKHLDIVSGSAELGFGECWKRLVGMLGRLAPDLVEAAGTSLKFSIVDGKYRRQVYALDDQRKGLIQIYLPDIMAAAQKAGLVGIAEGGTIAVKGDIKTRIPLDVITADTKDIPDCCKPMLGWGRKALRIEIGVAGEEKQVRMIEKLCALAAETWATAPAQPSA